MATFRQNNGHENDGLLNAENADRESWGDSLGACARTRPVDDNEFLAGVESAVADN